MLCVFFMGLGQYFDMNTKHILHHLTLALLHNILLLYYILYYLLYYTIAILAMLYYCYTYYAILLLYLLYYVLMFPTLTPIWHAGYRQTVMKFRNTGLNVIYGTCHK